MNIVLRAVLVYYALPAIIFLWGWAEPWVSVPAIALAVWGCCRAQAESPGLPSFRGKGLLLFCIGVLLIVGQQWMAGYTGDFPQHNDFSARNAMFGSLCREPWPMASPEGYPFVYYAAAWLPSALLKKIIPMVDANWVFMLQNCVALVAAFYVLCCRIGRVSLWFVAGALCMAAYPAAFGTAYDSLFGAAWVESYYGCPVLPAWLDLGTQVRTTINHGPYLILATALLLLPLRSKATYILIGALLLPITPLGAIGIFPLLMWRLLQGGVDIKPLVKNPVTWGAVLVFVVSALYFAQSEVQRTVTAFIWQMPLFGEVYKRFFIIVVLNMALFGAIFIPSCYKNAEFWIAYALFGVLPFVYYGYNYNELIFKMSAVSFVVFAALLPGLFGQKGKWMPKTIVLAMLVNSIIVCSVDTYGRCLSFGDKEKNILDPYHSDYYCEKAWADQHKKDGYIPLPPTSEAPPKILIPHVLTPPARHKAR